MLHLLRVVLVHVMVGCLQYHHHRHECAMCARQYSHKTLGSVTPDQDP